METEHLKLILQLIAIEKLINSNPLFDTDDAEIESLYNVRSHSSKEPFEFRVCDAQQIFTNQLNVFSVISGSFILETESESITVRQGQLCIVGCATKHTLIPENEWSIAISLLITRSYLQKMVVVRLPGNNILSPFFARNSLPVHRHTDYIISSSSEQSNGLMISSLYEYYHRKLGWDELLNSGIISIFTMIIREQTQKGMSMSTPANRKRKNLSAQELVLYISENCSTVSLQSISAHYHYHPNYFSKLIKKLTGAPYKALLHQARLDRACSLLEKDELTINQVSITVGYQNIDYFYTQFKSRFNITPSVYRERFCKYDNQTTLSNSDFGKASREARNRKK